MNLLFQDIIVFIIEENIINLFKFKGKLKVLKMKRDQN